MTAQGRKRLGETLIQQGLLTESQLRQALTAQEESGERLGETLVRLGYVTQNDIAGVLETQFGIPRLNLSNVNIDMQAVDKVPESLVKKHRVFPVAFADGDKKRLVLAMVDPLNIFAVDDVEIASGLQVDAALVTDEEMDQLINRYYGALTAAQEALGGAVDEVAVEPEDDLSAINEAANEAPIVKLVNGIIYEGVKAGASDIHIEPQEKDLRVRFRIDGSLKTTMQTSRRYHAGVVSRIKIMAGLDITERRLPQDGRIQRRIDSRDIDFRVSTLPTIYGEKVTMRILDKSKLKIRLEELGLAPANLERFKTLIGRPFGMVFIAGPTGSGKTTTLYSAASSLNSADRNLVTIENPVEFRLDGINQVEVNERIGLTFAKGLRSFLRQDPDVIVVGEVRDTETAQIAVQAALTGHLVFSTIHTNDAVSTIGRLMDMGIEPFLIASSIAGVISQRLVRRICDQCKSQYEMDAPTRLRFEAALGLEPGQLRSAPVYVGKGCSSCGNSGYKGRIAIHELFVMSDVLTDMVLKRQSLASIKAQAIKEGMTPIREDGLAKMFQGLTTPEELVKTFYGLD